MPSYATVSRVNSAFPAISSVSNITSAVICQVMDDVEAEVDAKISKRYVLPLTVTCPILTAIVTRETIYRIAVERGLVQFPPAQQGKAPLQVMHEADQKMLTAIVEGELQLISSSKVAVAENTTDIEVFSTTMGYQPTMHEGRWTDMVQDPSKLDDILSDRDLN